ncbi:MAG: hypothetical protein KC766_25730 [Myxococcales bacterium]|nr:hypothetical protein [Myxococcales bacterium]
MRVRSLVGAGWLCVACGGQVTSPEPSAEELLPTSAPVTLSVGHEHTCALRRSGKVACWGRGDEGQLGNWIEPSRPEPRDVRRLDVAVHSVLSGGAHGCVLTLEGSVWCWGRSDSGQAGSYEDVQYPAEVTELRRRVNQLSVGGAHNCALIRDGSVECWGRGGRGQLGHGFEQSAVPLSVQGLPQAQQVIAARAFSCALTVDGEIYCWGSASTGVLGDVVPHSVDTPTRIDLPAGVLRLASATADQLCALLIDGRLFCWGSTPDERIDVPSERSLEEPVSDVSVGGFESCAVTSSAELGCWAPHSLEVGARPPELSAVRGVSVGLEHACARTADELWCWGSTQYGQIGRNLNLGEPNQVILD